jgi:tetratricopeptide (TPR) repeat protein
MDICCAILSFVIMNFMTKKVGAKAAPKKKATAKAAEQSMQDVMEEVLRQVASVVGPEEAAAMIASLNAPSLDDDLSDAEIVAKYQAQQIAFDAMEATSDTTARKLAKRALRLDPDCVDALMVLNDVDARTQIDRIEGLQKAVAAGKRSLGATFFRENKGDFWILIQTRPYMRALETLGGEMAAVGMNLDAIAIYEEMLALNPNDNQGVRDPLLGLYLAVDDAAGAGKLLKRYKEDLSACFAWGRVIERFMAEDHTGAEAALRKAMQVNRFVVLQLTGREQAPKRLPDLYELGSVEEATLCQHYLLAAWAAHRDALFWVFDRCTEMSMAPVPSKAQLKKMKTPSAGVQ